MYNKIVVSGFNEPNFILKPISWYKQLANKQGRLESKAFLIEGERAVKQIIDTYPKSVIEILSKDELTHEYCRFAWRRITEKQLQSISSSKTPQSIVAVVKLPQGTYTGKLPSNIGKKVLLLENIQDPGNVGTLIRTAVAFDFDGIILSEKCADPFSPKCVQSTAGTILSVWIRRTYEYLGLVSLFKDKGYIIYVADLDGSSAPSVMRSQERLLLALGSEAFGPSESLSNIADYRVIIPIVRRKAESLNVAACGAICMYLSSLES